MEKLKTDSKTAEPPAEPGKGNGRSAEQKGTNGPAAAGQDRTRASGAKQGDARDATKGAALKAAFTQIERQFGQGSLMRRGDEAFAVTVSVIPSGTLSLDLALGVGGAPRA